MEDTPKVHLTTTKPAKGAASKQQRSTSKNREQRRRGSSRRRQEEGIDAESSTDNINEIGKDKENVAEPSHHQTTSSGVTINIENESSSKKLKVANSSSTIVEMPKSPAQRSTRSRASSDKSPKHKRSKSESRRRRERKLQAAGELEVRQANETLMRYLKQCSDLNDASGSLSGDLEISENLDDRKVHRKTKSQREKKSFRLIGKAQQQNDLTTILNELNDDMVQSEIYNPFTPVVSPTTDQHPQIVDKIFVQTSSGYRAVDNNLYYKSPQQLDEDSDSNNFSIKNTVQLSCAVQKIWINISNICHGLLGGLGLAHLIFALTMKPEDWSSSESTHNHFEMHAKIYTNVFFFLAVICFVSIMDRVDICQFSLSTLFNPTEERSLTISFRAVVLIMIYAGTILLNLLAAFVDDKFPVIGALQQTNMTAAILDGAVKVNVENVNEVANGNDEMIYLWNTLSIARSIGAIFGWIIVSFINTDLLYNTLVDMNKYHETP